MEPITPPTGKSHVHFEAKKAAAQLRKLGEPVNPRKRKLTFNEAMAPPPSPIINLSTEDRFCCYCGDEAKQSTSKEGRPFLSCSNSRFIEKDNKFESDCDFFLMLDSLIDEPCKCGLPLKQFLTKDKKKMMKMCVYKNAPTVWKKNIKYDCNILIGTKVDD